MKKTTRFYILGCLNRDQNQYIARGVPKVAVKPPPPFPTSSFVDKKLSCTIPKQPDMPLNGGETLVWDCYPLVLLRKVIFVE